MAVTATKVVSPFVPGAGRITVTEVLFDSAYVAGGEPLTASDLGLQTVDFAISTLKTAGTGSVTQVWYDVTNSKLKAYTAAAEAGVVDLSAVTAVVVAFGR